VQQDLGVVVYTQYESYKNDSNLLVRILNYRQSQGKINETVKEMDYKKTYDNGLEGKFACIAYLT
jgi:hypothetical protein